jgi:hypothetical protein
MLQGLLIVTHPQGVYLIAIHELPPSEGAGARFEGVAQGGFITGASPVELDGRAFTGIYIADHVAYTLGASFKDVGIANEEKKQPFEERKKDKEKQNIKKDYFNDSFQG